MRMVVENGSSKVVLFVVNCSDASDSSAIKQYCMMASETILAIKLGFRQINKTRIFGLHPRKKKKKPTSIPHKKAKQHMVLKQSSQNMVFN